MELLAEDIVRQLKVFGDCDLWAEEGTKAARELHTNICGILYNYGEE